MIQINLEDNEAKWIKDAILQTLENNYEGELPEDVDTLNKKLIAAPLERLSLMSEDWEAMRSLYKKLAQ